ncbi:MAG: DNA internalization-related competence protein ComEC/Rec2 [Candidatus Promineifilaceae bacterium]
MAVVQWTIAWMAGIWLASVLGWPMAVWGGTAVSCTVAALFLRRQKQVALLLVTLAAAGFGGVRYLWAQPVINETHIASYNEGDYVTVTGVVIDEPDIRDDLVNLRVAAERVRSKSGMETAVTGLVLVRAPRFPVIPYGTKIAINGRLQTPPDNPDFSYRNYLARQGIYSMISRPRITIVAENQGSPIKKAIFTFKQNAQTTINHILPDPQASLLAGILLGNDNGLPNTLAEQFRTTGLTHIIAISGFNIAILIAIMVSAAQPIVGRKPAVAAAIVGVTLYTILVGADASVVRAAIMGSLYLIASRLLGRPSFPYASLFLAALLMTAINPLTLWDVGFQLSFGATLGLMLYADPITRWTRRKLLQWLDWAVVQQIMGLLSEAVLVTLAAQILTLPLMIAYFGQLSVVSFLANALVLPVQPGVMLWGGMAALAGMAVPLLGQILGWVAWLFLSYTIFMVRLLATVPGAAVPVSLSPTAVLGMFAVIAAATWWGKATPQKRQTIAAWMKRSVGQKTAVSASLLGALVAVTWAVQQPDGRLHVAFLDVGQGDATLITTPDGRQILVDGGLFPSLLNDALGQQMPFWDREIDLVVATHPDADHVTGLATLFDRYTVGELLTNGVGLGESEVYDAVLRAAAEHDTPIRPVTAGTVIHLGDGLELTVLHPGMVLGDGRNDDSVTLRLAYGKFSLLLPGDLEEAGETAVMSQPGTLSSLVLKAGHHGANTSSSTAWLTAVQPQIIVISVGADNNFGHPHPDMLARAETAGAVVLRTDELGTIEVSTDGDVMWWQAGPKN